MNINGPNLGAVYDNLSDKSGGVTIYDVNPLTIFLSLRDCRGIIN